MAAARTTHSLEETWALDDDRRGRVDDHTAHGSCTDLAGIHVPHAMEVVSGYGQTGQYPPPQTCYESYFVTKILLYSAPPLPGVKPGSASNLSQLLTGKVELTLLFELQV